MFKRIRKLEAIVQQQGEEIKQLKKQFKEEYDFNNPPVMGGRKEQ